MKDTFVCGSRGGSIPADDARKNNNICLPSLHLPPFRL